MDKRNSSYCKDLTAYQAGKNVDEEAELVSSLIYILKSTIHLMGYELEGRIVLVNKKTGRVWR